MKSTQNKNRKIGILVLLLLIFLSVFPGKSTSPTYPYTQIILPPDYYIKTNHTMWFYYTVSGNRNRRIGITIEPPFYLSSLSIKKTIRPNLFGEIEIKGEILYRTTSSLDLNCWIYLFNNQDAVLFIKADNKSDGEIPFFYKISYEDEQSHVWKSSEIFPILYTSSALNSSANQIKIEKSNSQTTRGEPYFFQTLRYDEPIHQVFKGPLFTFKNLAYGLQQRVDSICSSEVTSHQGSIILKNDVLLEQKTSAEDWVFFSSNQLLAINSSVTQKVIQTLDFYKLKRFSRDGFYYKCLSDGYKGENDSTYYWDYSMYGARSILEYYYKGDQTLFYDIAILSYLSLARNRNPWGYWSNETVSNWLFEDYQIFDQFFDTRFNVDAGIFLLEIYQNFNIPFALTMAEKTGNILLVMMQNKKAYPTANEGLLLQDYDVSFSSSIRTHSSLNHVLNECSFFMLLFDVTGKKEYLEAGNQLIRGIMATEEQWKNKKTGDLFYCMHPDGSFGRTDYVTLTYHDLIRLRRILKKVLNADNKSIERLGSYKETFLLYLGLIKSKKFK
jgi:hypothetical protein